MNRMIVRPKRSGNSVAEAVPGVAAGRQEWILTIGEVFDHAAVGIAWGHTQTYLSAVDIKPVEKFCRLRRHRSGNRWISPGHFESSDPGHAD